jgi:hypothetical protein
VLVDIIQCDYFWPVENCEDAVFGFTHSLEVNEVCLGMLPALCCNASASGLRHRSANEKRRFAQAMDTANIGGLSQRDSEPQIARDELCHHFYANHLSAHEAAVFLPLGQAFL